MGGGLGGIHRLTTMKNTFLLASLLVGAVAAVAQAEIVVDGSLDAEYGDARAVQTTQTQFGDSNLGQIDYANGSEIDNAYGVIADGYLRLFFGGNLESNFNKFEVFIDFGPGGQNKLRGNNPDVDFNGLNRMGDDGTGNGLTFDAGFEADFYVTTTCGGGPFSTYANTSQILTKGGGTGEYIGSGGAGAAILLGSNGTLVGYNNSNVLGVLGGTGAGDGTGISTGVEFAIPVSLFAGYDGVSDIKVCAFINGGGHDYVSNQVAASMAGGNLGEPRNVNFSVVKGNQYFVVTAGGGGGTGCTGDVNNDLVVDASDLAFVLGAWGTADVDLNGDQTTDATDLAIVLGAWGACP